MVSMEDKLWSSGDVKAIEHDKQVKRWESVMVVKEIMDNLRISHLH